ncbi:MAG TPA: hypothetical protein VG265_14095 [Gaiellaceae bacterium]|nr:hypothetical protein [Gaiellaceae bacterium]
MKNEALARAVARVQALRDAIAGDPEEMLEELDSEPYGRRKGALEAYDETLDVLHEEAAPYAFGIDEVVLAAFEGATDALAGADQVIRSVPRKPLADFALVYQGDAVAELVYETLCDRGLTEQEAFGAIEDRYDYEPFGRLVDDVQGDLEGDE